MKASDSLKHMVLLRKKDAERIISFFRDHMARECGLVLIGTVSKDKITGRMLAYIADIYIEDERLGGPDSFEFTSEYLMNAKAYVNKNYRDSGMHIIGNCHSHAMYPSFWSGPDYEMMNQYKSNSVYLVVSPSHNTYKAAIKDDEFRIYENCEVIVVDGTPWEYMISQITDPDQEEEVPPFPPGVVIGYGTDDPLYPSEIDMDPKGNGRIERIVYHVHHHYTDAQHDDFDKRSTYKIDRLEGKRILIVGAGTIGNLLAMYAVFSGISDITVVDMDLYLTKNLPRSCLIRKEDVGGEKAIHLAKRMAECAPYDLRVEGVNKDIYELGWGFFKDFDAVISPVDSISARMYVDRGCRIHHIPHITCGTGLFQSELIGNVLSFPKDSCCDLEYFWGDGYKEDLFRRMSCSDLPETTFPQVMYFSAIVAGYTMSLVMRQLLGQTEDDSTAVKYNMNDIGRGLSKDKNAFRVSRNARQASYEESELYEVYHPEREIPSIRFSRTSPKADLFRVLNETLHKNSSYYDLDLRWSLNVPVAYHPVDAVPGIRVMKDGGVDTLWKRLPDSHVYCVTDEDGEADLVEITLSD